MWGVPSSRRYRHWMIATTLFFVVFLLHLLPTWNVLLPPQKEGDLEDLRNVLNNFLNEFCFGALFYEVLRALS